MQAGHRVLGNLSTSSKSPSKSNNHLTNLLHPPYKRVMPRINIPNLPPHSTPLNKHVLKSNRERLIPQAAQISSLPIIPRLRPSCPRRRGREYRRGMRGEGTCEAGCERGGNIVEECGDGRGSCRKAGAGLREGQV